MNDLFDERAERNVSSGERAGIGRNRSASFATSAAPIVGSDADVRQRSAFRRHRGDDDERLIPERQVRKETSVFLSTDRRLAAACGAMESLGATREANRAARSAALAADRVVSLVRRALTCLESDRQTAMRCLHDVSVVLGADTQDSGAPPAAMLSGFQPGGLARWQARRVVEYIEENLASRMDIRELAALVAFSRSHFSRAFKRSLGLSPMAYVVKRRVERAKVMIISTDAHLTEIALACGFADQSHLNRSFHRAVGMSPGRWRRSNAEVDDAKGG